MHELFCDGYVIDDAENRERAPETPTFKHFAPYTLSTV
jgi:hypothetical protein